MFIRYHRSGYEASDDLMAAMSAWFDSKPIYSARGQRWIWNPAITKDNMYESLRELVEGGYGEEGWPDFELDKNNFGNNKEQPRENTGNKGNTRGKPKNNEETPREKRRQLRTTSQTMSRKM